MLKKLILFFQCFFVGTSICNFGLKVYGKTGPSKASNVAVVPLKTPTFAVVGKDDDNGVDFTQIAEILFGTIGAMAAVVPAVVFIQKWIKRKRDKKKEPKRCQKEEKGKIKILS